MSSTFRLQFVLGALACIGLMAYALYAQYHLQLEPCPLCVFQRVAVIALGVVFAIGALHAPDSAMTRRVYAVLALLPALAGLAVAGRQLWLQSLPADQVPACGPGLNYMMDSMPFAKVLAKVFMGSGECAEVNWRFLGLAMPAWVAISLVALGIWAVSAGFRKR
jgi:disulfide bond formation protein DsbB